MKYQLFPTIIFAIALSIVSSKIVYFGFTPNYYLKTRVSKQLFHQQFDHDVFKYRILSKYLLLAVDDFLSNSVSENKPNQKIHTVIKNESERFYSSFFYLNTFFLCITSVLIILLLELDNVFKVGVSEKYLILSLLIIIINISQFALYYYDISSYCFQILILYIFFRYFEKDYGSTILAISALVFLSTLNRESSALSVAAISLLIFQKKGISKKSIIGICLISTTFLITYISLRYVIQDPYNISYGYIDAGKLFSEINIFGWCFWVLFFFLSIVLANSKENRIVIIVYHIISLPYVFVCFKDGVLWEIRLYIPLFLASIFLGKLKTSGFMPLWSKVQSPTPGEALNSCNPAATPL